jgi:Mn-dependent DtxR family transcriptional regulator
MHICSGHIKYVVAIVEISKSSKSKNIRCIDVAKFLGVTRPSVTKMLKCLVNSNLINENFAYGIKLTKEGLEIGNAFHKQYTYIYTFFNKMLNIPSEDAKEQALRFISTFPLETSTKFGDIIDKTLKKKLKTQ